jgi:hypothetical protein
VLEPDDGKPSSPVLRGLGASNGARPLDRYPASTVRISPEKFGLCRAIQDAGFGSLYSDSLLAVQMSGSRKCDSAECRSRPISQKAVWTVRSVSHSTSKSN